MHIRNRSKTVGPFTKSRGRVVVERPRRPLAGIGMGAAEWLGRPT